MKVGDIVFYYDYNIGVKLSRKPIIGQVIDKILVGSDDAEWFEVAYYNNTTDKVEIHGLFEAEAISCFGSDVIDEMVNL